MNKYKEQMLFGSLVFTAMNGDYAMCSMGLFNKKFIVRGGTSNLMSLGSDVTKRKLNAIEATNLCLHILGIEHHEDIWCNMKNQIEIYGKEQIGRYEKRPEGSHAN